MSIQNIHPPHFKERQTVLQHSHGRIEFNGAEYPVSRKLEHQYVVAALSTYQRSLEGEKIKYLLVDGVNFAMRAGRSVETVEEWQALRTTNIIERLNKEFKRRTKSMEIVAGENACYRLLVFISLKMEMHWKGSPFGRIHTKCLTVPQF